MKNIGTLIIVIALFVPSSLAFAAQQGSGAGDRIQEQDQVRDPSTHTGTEPDQTRLQTQDRIQLQSTTSVGVQEQDRTQDRLQIHLEATTTQIHTGLQLQQTVREREQELNQEASSSPAGDQQIIQNENRVRLAVHALLAAEQVLGGIGPQVSQLAQDINSSVQLTAKAEAQVQARGFWTKLFFGGDKGSAQIIQQQVTQNQTRIQQLTQLMSQTNVSADIAAQLQAQIQAMQQEQDRLQMVAQTQLRSWGIFSWRF